MLDRSQRSAQFADDSIVAIDVVIVALAENGRAGHERISTGTRNLGNIGGVDATVDFKIAED